MSEFENNLSNLIVYASTKMVTKPGYEEHLGMLLEHLRSAELIYTLLEKNNRFDLIDPPIDSETEADTDEPGMFDDLVITPANIFSLISGMIEPDVQKAEIERIGNMTTTALVYGDEVATLAVVLNFACAICHRLSVNAGWYTHPTTGLPIESRNIPEMMMLTVSELAEAMEAYRKNRNDDHLPDRPGVEVEFADTIIRVFDLCGYLNLDLGGATAAKLRYNSHRLDHRLENRALEGGKSF